MKPLPPGTFVIMQSYLTGGGQVRLRCRKCWLEFERDLPRLPNTDHSFSLVGACPRCNHKDRYGQFR